MVNNVIFDINRDLPAHVFSLFHERRERAIITPWLSIKLRDNKAAC